LFLLENLHVLFNRFLLLTLSLKKRRLFLLLFPKLMLKFQHKVKLKSLEVPSTVQEAAKTDETKTTEEKPNIPSEESNETTITMQEAEASNTEASEEIRANKIEPTKAVDEPSKTEENTPEKMEVVENGIDEKKEEAELPYKDDQWSPANKDGKKQYDRDFLMKLQTNPLSLQKPGTLPDNMEVILITPALENIKSVASVPNLNRAFDMNPQYIRSSTSHSRTPRSGIFQCLEFFLTSMHF
jgi:hypothetical protein